MPILSAAQKPAHSQTLHLTQAETPVVLVGIAAVVEVVAAAGIEVGWRWNASIYVI